MPGPRREVLAGRRRRHRLRRERDGQRAARRTASALRLVGFTAEDAGYIDNVLVERARARPSTTRASSRRTSTASETIGARAALRFDISENVDLTLGADLPGHDARTATATCRRGRGRPEPGALRGREPRGRVVPGRADVQRVAAVRATWSLRRRISTASSPTRRTRPTTSSAFQTRQRPTRQLVYDFGGDPRGFATNNEDTEITTLEVRLQSNNDAESRWSWLGGVFYSKEDEPHGIRQLRARLRRHAGFAYFDYSSTTSTTATAGADRQLVAGRLRHGDSSSGRVFGEVAFDVTENFTHHGRRPLVRVRQQVSPPAGVAGRVQRVQVQDRTRRHGRRSGNVVQAEPHLPHRRRPDGLCDLVGRVPQRRQQPAAAEFDPAARVQLRTRSTTRRSARRRSGWRTACASTSRPTTWSWDDFAVQVEDPQPERVPARLRQSADRRDPGRRGGAHVPGQRRLADRRDARLQRRARSRRRRS